MTLLLVFRIALFALAALCLTAGMVLAAMANDPTFAGGRWRSRLIGAWRLAGGEDWVGLVRRGAAGTADWLDAVLDRYFVDIDRSPAFGPVFLGVLVLVLPLLAAINALVGGSPFLLQVYGVALAALVALVMVGEWRWAGPVAQVLAVAFGGLIVVFVPTYVFRSFADRVLRDVIDHAVMESLLVLPFCFIAAYGVGLLGGLTAGRAWNAAGRRQAWRLGLAAVPLAYPMVNVTFLVGHLVAGERSMARTWPLLLAGMAGFALAIPLLHAMARRIARRRGAAGMAIDLGLLGLGSLALGAGAILLGYVDAARPPCTPMIGQALMGSPLEGLGRSAADGRLAPWVGWLPFLPGALFTVWLVLLGAVRGIALAWRGLGSGREAAQSPVTATLVALAAVGLSAAIGGLMLTLT